MKSKSDAGNASLLIIFYRNPTLGKVKTRLSKTLGDAKALAVYLHLASHTKSITENLDVDKALYYASYVDTEDNWDNVSYKKFLQSGKDLGERMSNAFQDSFESSYTSICIIGTDCFDLSPPVIDDAFAKLQSYDVVIGPATDGGYYLLGMNAFHAEFFENKLWSTSSVCADTIRDFNSKRLLYHQLPMLSDVDEAQDLPAALAGL